MTNVSESPVEHISMNTQNNINSINTILNWNVLKRKEEIKTSHELNLPLKHPQPAVATINFVRTTTYAAFP